MERSDGAKEVDASVDTQIHHKSHEKLYDFWEHHKLLTFDTPNKHTQAGDELVVYLKLPLSD